MHLFNVVTFPEAVSSLLVPFVSEAIEPLALMNL